MAELAPADLPAAVLARFVDGTAAQQAIDAALGAARRYCGWHVSPSKSETIVADGPGGRVLSLPTLHLTAVAAVTELGVVLDVTALDRSQSRGTLTKQFGCWSARSGAITAVITHGFTESEAADWRNAVLTLVDNHSRSNRRDSPNMASKKVDDVEYQWFQTIITLDEELASTFSQFRILPSP